MLHRINGPVLHRLFSNLAFVASTHESNTIQRLRGTCKLVACANVKPTKCEHIYLMEIRRTIRLNTYTASSFVVVQIHQTSCCFIIFLRIDEFTWKHHAIIYVLKIRANNYIPLNILEEEERKKKKQHILKNRTNLRATAPLPFSLFTSDAIIARAFCEIAFRTCSGYWPSQRSRIYCMNVSGLPTFWPIKSKTEHKLLESTKHLPLRCESEAYLFQRLHRKCLPDRPTDWMLCNSIDCCGIDIGILLVPFSLPTQSPASKQRQKKTTSWKLNLEIHFRCHSPRIFSNCVCIFVAGLSSNAINSDKFPSGGLWIQCDRWGQHFVAHMCLDSCIKKCENILLIK